MGRMWARGAGRQGRGPAAVAGALVGALYPPACLACGAPSDDGGEPGLCGPCWREAAFLGGPGQVGCGLCGAPLPGTWTPDASEARCDGCLRAPPPWTQGRAALAYGGTGRALVLALKHGDRTDLARPLGGWLARAARPLLRGGEVLVPVPLHWTRLLGRRYNQAALLARAAGAVLGLPVAPDALCRTRRTPSLGQDGPEGRRAALDGAVRPNGRRGAALRGRRVLLVDDVMTTGATLAACTRAAKAAGAAEVGVVVLARALRDG